MWVCVGGWVCCVCGCACVSIFGVHTRNHMNVHISIVFVHIRIYKCTHMHMYECTHVNICICHF